MAWSRKWVNNTASEVSVAAVTDAALLGVDSGGVYGYAGSVVMPAYTGIYSSADNTEMDLAAAAWTVDKYISGVKVFYPGQRGYAGSLNTGARGYSGSVGAVGYTGSGA